MRLRHRFLFRFIVLATGEISKKGLLAFVLLIFAFALPLRPLSINAAPLVLTLGAQHFTDGQKPVGPGTFDTVAAGEPAPFNAFIGSNVTGPNFSATWGYSYSAPPSIAAATLTLGIVDGDSKASNHTVALFRLNGLDLTSSLNTVFQGHGGSLGEYDVYTLQLPGSTFGALESGSVSFLLTLQGPGLGVLGPTPFLGAGFDFSTLVLNPVPEPAPLVSVFTGVFILGYRSSRRRFTT
ncbi:MAG: hypothetical protein JO076_04640 [Verrucomicrobia bacterium]|nr:hypothetical protein [Verrucomicrobiota bacterium]